MFGNGFKRILIAGYALERTLETESYGISFALDATLAHLSRVGKPCCDFHQFLLCVQDAADLPVPLEFLCQRDSRISLSAPRVRQGEEVRSCFA